VPSSRPEPTPLEVDDVRVVAVGTALWALLLVGLLPFRAELAREGRTWWFAMCAFGVALGVFGMWYCRRRRAALDRDAGAAFPSGDADELPPPLS